MSSALAIAAVTASLKDLINDGLVDHDLSAIGSFTVTALPPDRVTTGGTETNVLNLFLYQITANSGWRNVDLPSRDRAGTRITNPPLALDLHYLLTAYGSQDLNAEILLGYAMQVLHDNPVFSREQLRTSLGSPAPVDGALLPGPFGTMSAIDLADQAEQIKLTPVFLSAEDLSKLWTAMQARYRPSMAYSVSVVLIQSEEPARSALPVLKRGPDDRGPVAQGAPAPVLISLRASASPAQPALRLGEDVLIEGTNLRPSIAQLALPRFDLRHELQATQAARGQLSLHLPGTLEAPTAMEGWVIGVYNVALRITAPNAPAWTTNTVPLVLAPRITVSPTSHAAGTVTLDVTCAPRLRPVQHASTRLLFGSREVQAKAIATPADTTKPTTLTFEIPSVVAGEYVVRLRVDGIDSLPVIYGGSPPTPSFDPQQKVSVT